MHTRTTLLSLSLLFAASACGTQKEGAGASADVTTAPELTVALATIPPSTTVESTPATPVATAAPAITTTPVATAVPTSAPGANPFGGNSPEDSLMPPVVCMNLQEAQDEIQDHGVFFSRSEDATGNGRMQINDSNWQVVAQYPDAGTPIGEAEAVLFVVKYGEQPNPC